MSRTQADGGTQALPLAPTGSALRRLFILIFTVLGPPCVLGLVGLPARAQGEMRVERWAGDENQLPSVGSPVPRLNLDLEPNRSAVAPDGTVFITDSWRHVVYRVGADDLVHLVAGTFSPGAGPDEGVATEIDLQGPWGADVDVNGDVYFVDGGFLGPGRIRKLEVASGTLRTVGQVANAAQVKVASDDVLYVAAKDGLGSGGVWKLELDGTPEGLVTPLLSGVDSEGIALAADGTLYVAAVAPGDAYVCAMDPDVPGVCSVIQRQAAFGTPVGPQLDDVVFDPAASCWIYLIMINAVQDPHVVDVEVDSSGTLHLFHVQRTFFKSETRYGGYLPMIYSRNPPSTEATLLFGDTFITPEECIVLDGHDAIPDTTPAPSVARFYGSAFSLDAEGMFLTEQTIAAFGFFAAKKRSYFIGTSVPICGLGPELAPLLAVLWALRRRRSRSSER